MSTLVPPWISRVIEAGRVSIWRCEGCLCVYRRSHWDPCTICGRAVVQWKKCTRCARWKSAPEYYKQRGKWLDSWCRRCHSIYNAAVYAKRYHSDPEFAERIRKARRGRLASQQAQVRG